MDIRRKVESSVRQAFDRAGTLAQVVSFSSKATQGFDFQDMTAEVKDIPTVNLKAIPVVAKKDNRRGDKEPRASNTVCKQLIMISKDIPNLSTYDQVAFDGYTWKVVHPIEDNGYTTTVNVTREG